MLNRRLNLVLFPVLLSLFGYGISTLFELRFDQGDFYAPYSSLRADPVGTRALHDAFSELEGVECVRLYESIRTIEGGKNTTILVLGTGPAAFRWVSSKQVRDINQFVHRGGRLVFSLLPTPRRSYWDKRNERLMNERGDDIRREYRNRKKDKGKGEKRKTDDDDADDSQENDLDLFDNEDEERKFRRWFDELMAKSLFDEWGVSIKWKNLELDEEDRAIPEAAHPGGHAPNKLTQPISVHTAAVFEPDEESDWRVIYERDNDPVIIERPLGSGSIVFAADSYHFSNEAMRNDRDLALLGWFAGGANRLVFDELHLGVMKREGVATLGRKYRLHGLVAGLIALALLFIWKNATTLTPPLDDAVTSGAAVTGRESSAGFVNLLRRTVSPSTLIGNCVREWIQSHPRLRKHASAMTEIASRENFERASIVTVKKYREICELLKRH